MASRSIYSFDEPIQPGRDRLGGKGHGLAQMTSLGLPVPPGFTITTDACLDFQKSGALSDELWAGVLDHLHRVEEVSCRQFGSEDHPLLVSVRSGAPVSMPGMMDTILNVGLNDKTVAGLAQMTGDERFALDSYRRLIQMYGEVVEGIEPAKFDDVIKQLGCERADQLDPAELPEVVGHFKGLVRHSTGKPFPEDPLEQLRSSITAVFRSWNGRRARTYRAANNISDDMGTAATIVMMVFGNLGEDSGTGVAFTRSPSTGEPGIFGEFLANAQGEDVVAGLRTPKPISEMRDAFPAAWAELNGVANRLEGHYRDMQDIEFTIERGRLFVLQTRTGKRTAAAAARIAVDLVQENLLSEEEALLRLDPATIIDVLQPGLPPDHGRPVAARGLGASPGAVSGFISLDADDAEARALAGEPVILVRPETSPDDIHGFIQARGILTARGGMTSHAAVVARGMGKPCITACNDLAFRLEDRTITLGAQVLSEGDMITIDGGSGCVIVGEVALEERQQNQSLETLLEWADARRRLRVLANADTPADARQALDFGAEGIGLCRTEHMFFAPDRLPVVQDMILAGSDQERAVPLQKLMRMQEEDFRALLDVMDGRPVIIRLLDPPLHEFLPDEAQATSEAMRARIRELSETNPMLGTRGSRLGLMHPDIYEMQVRAIAHAVAKFGADRGFSPPVRIMLPLIAYAEELRQIRQVVQTVLEQERCPHVPIGTMLEVPRACLAAAELMEHANFFSLGTNDLTQTTLGFSRDDAERGFLPGYISSGILESNPFVTVDTAGVGWLIRHVVSSTRAIDPSFSIGVCGEHGGDPASIRFFHEAGVGYVSCSPFRVPTARLAAAQAAIRERNLARDHSAQRSQPRQAPEVVFEAARGKTNGSTQAAGKASRY